MNSTLIAQIFFIYGLAFFATGLAILLEVGRATDPRFRHALGLLAFFGLVHGGHEWLEMFEGLGILPGQLQEPLVWRSTRIAVLAISFLGLGGFGASLLAPGEGFRRWSLAVPLALAVIWGVGLLAMKGRYAGPDDLWDVADVWTRYVLAIPSALLAAAGLLVLRRSYRRAGLEPFGRDSLIAATAFVIYGVIGQSFTRESLLPPSTVVNVELFTQLFGFPVQLLRAAAAIVVAVSVIHFLRSFQVEREQQVIELQSARLREAERRQELRGELLNRVVQAQEAERQRIARELHDETGQALTAIGMGLRGIASRLGEDAEKSTKHLRHLEGLIDRALTELQRLIAGLRPSHLDDLGLPAALRWYAGEVEGLAPLTVRFKVEGEERTISALLKIGLFRVAQEALTNVIKHSSANEARINLRYEDDFVQLEVRDDGVGFDTAVAASSDRPSWGLMGMRERIALMGGEFNLSSQKGEGTTIRVHVPYAPKDEGEHDRATAAGG